MRKLLSFFAFCMVCSLGFAQSYNVIEQELQEVLNQRTNDLIEVNIYFKSQIDSKSLESKTQRATDATSRREIVVGELKDFSTRSQSDVLDILYAEERGGNATDINSMWIVNAISCKATRDVIYELSSHPDILSIGYDKVVQIIDDKESFEVKDKPATRGSAAPHVLQVRANQVWNQGYTGKNVIVAVLDSGTNIDHYDLKDHL